MEALSSSEALDSPTRVQKGAVTRDNIVGVSWEWAAWYWIPTVPVPYEDDCAIRYYLTPKCFHVLEVQTYSIIGIISKGNPKCLE